MVKVAAQTKPEPFPLERFKAFCSRLRVNTKDFGLVPLEFLGTQIYVMEEIAKGMSEGISTFVILKARQLGMSTFFIALDMFWAFEHAGLTGAFATHTEQSRDQFRNIIKVFHQFLPKGYKWDYDTENRSMMILKNGSMFVYLVAGVKEKSKGSLGRSGAFQFLHATEVAFWGSEEDLKELRATMSTHYPFRLQIYETTANGFNHFEEMWRRAKDSPTQRAIFVGWWRHDHYRFERGHSTYFAYMPEGIETPLHAVERRRKKAVFSQYGVEITDEQVAWYRWKLDDECDGDQSKMDEMFPWVEEDAFVATGSKFFTNESLTLAQRRARGLLFMPYRYKLTDRWIETGVSPTRDSRGELKIWEEADQSGHYVLGCDPAYGSSDEADRTCISVMRCYADRIIQVAEFCTPSVSTYQCAWVLAHLAGYFRGESGALVILEITGPGSAVWQELGRLRNELRTMTGAEDGTLRAVLSSMRFYLYSRVDSMGGSLAWQWKTTRENKQAMFSAFKDAIELNRCLISSMACLEEMKKVVWQDGTIEAEGRGKDDRVMASGLAHYAWMQRLRMKLAGRGLTWQRAQDDEAHPKADTARKLVLDYLRTANINIAERVKQ